MKLKSLALAAFAALAAAVAGAATYRVAPDAAADGDGSSWSSPATLASALAKTADGDTVLLKAGTYALSATVSVTKGVAVEGGYAGTDDTALADEPLSVLDAEGTTFTSVVDVSAGTSGQTTALRRLVIKNGYACGVNKTGNADLLVESCLIATNGLASGSKPFAAKGCYVNASGATVTFRDTVFRANRQEENVKNGSIYPALSVNAAKALVVEDCGFFGNCIKATTPAGTGESSYYPLGDEFVKGSAIFTKAKATISRCRFSGNSGNVRGSSEAGGTVWFDSGSSGSVVSGCLFAGNYDRAAWYNDAQRGGAIVMNMGDPAHTLEVYGSTIAYNLADGTQCPAGITAIKGSLVVDGCVFAGNMVNPYTVVNARDIVVRPNAGVTVRNSVFESRDGAFYVEEPAKGGGLVLESTVAFGDPLLVTRPETITGLLVPNNRNNTNQRFITFGTDDSVYEALEAIDAHVMSVTGYVTNEDKSTWLTADAHSPAIDLAGADFEVGDETAPNGGRRNAGFYGGTAEASRSALNALAMEESAVAVTIDDDFHPTVTAAISGDATFNAVLDLEIFTADPRTDATAEPSESETFAGLRAGDSRTLSGVRVYLPGTTLYARATATVPGLASVVVVKEVAVSGAAPAFAGHGGDSSSVVHVRGGAANKRDGTSWLDACATLEEALAIAAADATKTEIWIMGTAVSTKQVTTAFAPAAETLTVRGGFTGAEDSADARPAEGLSYVDGQHLYNPCILANAKGHDVVFERVAFMNAVMNGIVKTGGGNLTVTGCHFLTNGLASYSPYSWTGKEIPGRGIRVTGAGGAKIVVKDCEFRMNLQKTVGNRSSVGSPGAALSLEGCASAEVSDSRFHANGVWMYENGYGSGSYNSVGDSGSYGSAIYTTVKTAVTRCEFSGNANNVRNSWTSGGVVWFANGASGSAVSNCLFKGNADFAKWNQINGNYGGAIVVNLGSSSQTVEVYGSTFAYNLTDATLAAAGMTVYKGTASVVNCVFGGGIVPSSAALPSSDVRVKTDGVLNASYTVFGGDQSSTVVCEGSGKFVQGEGVVFADPLFVTTADDVAALYKRNTTYTYFYSGKYAELEAIDAHLRSVGGYVTNEDKETWLKAEGASSPAIDAGVGDYENEPDFNGNRRNAGCYGNTAEASKSLKSTTEITFADVALTYPSGYSRPQLEFTVTGDAGVSVSVTLRYKAGNGDWSDYVTLLGCLAGAKSVYLLPEFFAKDTKISFEISGSSTAGEVVATSAEATIEADLPPWYGRGGGDGVLHVWSGAPGLANGKDWNNACRTWKEAVDLYNAADAGAYSAIWIVDVANPVADTPTLTTKAALAIRGGFSNMADTADAREAGTVSAISGIKTYAPVILVNEHEVSVERLVFTLAPNRAFVKTGAGDLAVVDCAFTNNARGAGFALEGAGLSVTGTRGTTKVSVSRCAFLDNGSTGAYNMGWGQGAFFKNCASVVIEDCVFEKNGSELGSITGNDRSYGSALYATSAPLTARRCAFRSNHGKVRGSGNLTGGAVRIEGAATPTVFENCLFAGNSDQLGWIGQPGDHGGALVVNCDSADDTVDVSNCTFAYNVAAGRNSPSALNVYKGTVTAVNSIFWGNFTNTASAAGLGVDVDVKADGSFSARYCLFSSMDANSYSATGGGTLSVDTATCFSADPLFATDIEDVEAKVTYGSTTYFMSGFEDFLTTLDVHLRGKRGYLDERTGEVVKWSGVTSPAVDAGDPSTSCKSEAQPNGSRVNLGAYGNTAWATLSSGGFIFVVR